MLYGLRKLVPVAIIIDAYDRTKQHEMLVKSMSGLSHSNNIIILYTIFPSMMRKVIIWTNPAMIRLFMLKCTAHTILWWVINFCGVLVFIIFVVDFAITTHEN